jgi:hypothetical protein
LLALISRRGVACSVFSPEGFIPLLPNQSYQNQSPNTRPSVVKAAAASC